jgi:hypothetical protein
MSSIVLRPRRAVCRSPAARVLLRRLEANVTSLMVRNAPRL